MNPRDHIARIEALEAALREGDPPAEARLDPQIERLEATALKLERRIAEMTAEGDEAAALDSLFEEEREVLALRLSKLRDKIALLRAEQLDAPSATFRAPPRTESELRAELHALVLALRADPTTSEDAARPWQRRAAELVRSRRARLDGIIDALGHVRDAVLRYVTMVEALLARVDDDALWVGGADPAVAAPFADERQRAALRASAAARALADTWVDLRELARQWPELWPIARRPDHRNIPLTALARLVTDSGEGSVLRRRDGMIGALREARETGAACALWIGELRKAVQQAPAPGTEVSGT